MAIMMRLSLTLSLLALSVGLAAGQSLAEVAKKEKERRSKNSETSKTVITDRDLTQGYGGLPTAPAGRSTTSTTEGEAQEDSGEEEQPDQTRTREYWQNRLSGVREKIQSLEQKLASDDWGEGQRLGVDPMGPNNLSERQKVEQDLAAARAELTAIQVEGRRAGVPAGWLR